VEVVLSLLPTALLGWVRDWLLAWPPKAPVVVAALLVLGDQVLRLVSIATVPRDRRPSSAWAWLLAIFFLPYLGVAAFLLIGNPKLPRGRREKQRRINEMIMARTTGMDRVSTGRPWPPWLTSVVHLNRHLGSMPLVRDNTATLHTGYCTTITTMAGDVDRAKDFVHAEFYILNLDATSRPLFDALERAVARGVTVRVLLDHVASLRTPGYGATVRHLERIGVLWHPMLPVQPLRGRFQRPDLRNHRKLLVVDGVVAWTGSQNMVDRGYHKKRYRRRGLQWKDLMVRLQGPVVAEVNALFVTDWYSETDDLLVQESEPVPPPGAGDPLECQVVPSGPGFAGENNLKLFNALFYYAQERVVVTSPYFVPDDSLLYAITTAAERGLLVELFVSEIGDQWLVFHAQRSYYEALLRAGVRIYLYPAPYVLHAKHVTIDDEVAVFGSSNMDMRSSSLNLEISVMVHGAAFVQDLRAVEAEYRRRSRELTLEEWLRRPWRDELVDNLARLTSALQ
jgi:cardiolipin synthase A/B